MKRPLILSIFLVSFLFVLMLNYPSPYAQISPLPTYDCTVHGAVGCDGLPGRPLETPTRGTGYYPSPRPFASPTSDLVFSTDTPTPLPSVTPMYRPSPTVGTGSGTLPLEFRVFLPVIVRE